MEILVIKLGAMGDVLRTTTLLPALKEKYKGCFIDWVTKSNSLDLIKNNPHIRTVYAIEKKEKMPKKYDYIINFDDEDAACKLASKIQTKKLVGAFIKDGNRAYTPDANPWFDMGLISRFGKKKADQLKATNKKTYQEIHFSILGLKDPKKYPPQLVLDKKNIEFAEAFSKKNKIDRKLKTIGINTGAGGRWQDKKLSEEQTVFIINAIQKEKKVNIILFGGPEEVERNKNILKKTKNVFDAGCDNSLLDFAALVGLCDVVLTSDSLAMHVGISLHKKIVAFFYPTPAQEIELYDNGTKIMGVGKDYCSYKPTCDYPATWNLDKIIRAVVDLAR